MENLSAGSKKSLGLFNNFLRLLHKWFSLNLKTFLLENNKKIE